MSYKHEIKLDHIIVVDIEATCWEKKPPKGEENEIIEIGICTLDVHSGERLMRESILVKPERSTVSEFCTRLTSLTQAQVDQGISFKEACKYLVRRFDARERTWASYGDYDRVQFQRQCARFEIAYPFSDRHMNIKNLFAIVHGLKREVGMAEALRLRNFTLEGTHHRGDDDAWNTARLLSELLLLRRELAKPSVVDH